MTSARGQGKIIAETEISVVIEGNHDLPLDFAVLGFLRPSDTCSHYPGQGLVHDDVVAIGNTLRSVACFYPQAKGAYGKIRRHGAYWRRVEVQE